MTHSGHARLRLNNRAVCCTCSRPVLAPRAIRRSASKLVAIEAKRTCRERRESVDPAEIGPISAIAGQFCHDAQCEIQAYGACREVPVPDPQSSGLSELEVSLARRGEQVAYAPKSPHVSLGIGNRMGQGQLTCTTRSPIAASTEADHSRVTRYRFGTKTADFHVCVTCGVIPIVTCVIEGIRYAVFNVNTFEKVDRSQLVETATNFEGETTESRLARRRRNWTPEAIPSEGGD